MSGHPGPQAAGGAAAPAAARMHPYLLRLAPREHEQAFFSQLEQLDLLNAAISPLVIAFYMSLFRTDLLPAVHCVVLLMKGYQLVTLVLPAARQVGAHAQVRYPILLTERLLRQILVVALVGRGPRFKQWVAVTTATNSPTHIAVKMLLVVSGVSVVYPITLGLPLDILTQVFINTLFLAVHLPPTLATVAYAPARLVSSWPQLVWLQWLLEYPCSVAVASTQTFLQWAAADTRSARVCEGSSYDNSTRTESLAQLPLLDQPTHQLTAPLRPGWGAAAAAAAAAAVGTPAGPAPDLDSTAGRLILALSAFWMLFVVWFGPLYVSWCLERRLKSRFVAGVLASGQRQVQLGSAGRARADTSSSGDARSNGAASSRSKQVACVPPAQLTPPQVLPLFPQPLLLHLGRAAAACFVAAELLVLVCVRVPAVAGLLWPQEVF